MERKPAFLREVRLTAVAKNPSGPWGWDIERQVRSLTDVSLNKMLHNE